MVPGATCHVSWWPDRIAPRHVAASTWHWHHCT